MNHFADYLVDDNDLDMLVALLILCAKHQIGFKGVPYININKLVALNKSQILHSSSLQHRPLFKAKIDG